MLHHCLIKRVIQNYEVMFVEVKSAINVYFRTLTPRDAQQGEQLGFDEIDEDFERDRLAMTQPTRATRKTAPRFITRHHLKRTTPSESKPHPLSSDVTHPSSTPVSLAGVYFL